MKWQFLSIDNKFYNLRDNREGDEEVGFLELRVTEAYSADVGRKIAMMSAADMRKLGVETGDFLRLDSDGRLTVARVWPLGRRRGVS